MRITIPHFNRTTLIGLAAILQGLSVSAADWSVADFHPTKTPAPVRNILKEGDRLAICGDSITEQKMYSRIMETYLTVCVPQLNVMVRQYGWGGEKANGFLARMTNDCLRFKPTVATTCYGMNDFEYRLYEDRIGTAFRNYSTAVVEAFKANGVRVVQGSSGCVGASPKWANSKHATREELNQSLCKLRNIGVEIAKKEKVGFADVFWPMLTGLYEAEHKYGTNYALAGKDGVHPGWAGHVIMAYAFLHALGLDGDIGTFTVDLRSGKAKVSAGHDLDGFANGELKITSHRYPFCIGAGDPAKDDNMLSGTTLVPFNQDLNRLMLVVPRPSAKSYKVTWGETSRSFTAAQLSKGVNLAAEFAVNPFSEAFKKVDEAVAEKQKFETEEIKRIFRGLEARADFEGTAAKAEAKREPLAAAIKTAFVPVTHTIKIEAE